MFGSAKTLSIALTVALATSSAALAGAGQTQGPISAIGPDPYTGAGSSELFPSGCARLNVEYYLEDFEDGDVNSPGLEIPVQQRDILAPGPNTDSVDSGGFSMRASNASAGSVSLVFDDLALGGLPVNVGFVLTDTNGASNSNFTVFVIDGNGNNASFNFSGIGDGTGAANTSDDVFIGVSSAFGIEQVQILSPAQNWELDHIQYSKLSTPALASRGDTDGSGTGDILFHQPSNKVTSWYLNDTVETPTVIRDSLSGTWTLQGFGDVDGDCDDDIIFRNGPKVRAFVMENGLISYEKNISNSLVDSWQVAAINDFDGDGIADIFLKQDASNKMKIWFLNGPSVDHTGTVTAAGFNCSEFSIHTTGDVDGDGKADIIWRKNSNGDLRYFRMAGSTVLANGLIQSAIATSWVGIGGGDLNRDGTVDIGFRNSTTGIVLLALLASDFTVDDSVQLSLASGFTFIGFPDVNGDGRADLVWRKDSTGSIVRWKMNGLSITSSSTIGTGPTTSGVKTYAER